MSLVGSKSGRRFEKIKISVVVIPAMVTLYIKLI